MVFKLNDCRKEVKNVSYRSIPSSKYEYNDLNEKFYWRKLIDEVEKLAKQKAKKTEHKFMDLWSSLPPKLHAQVSKYIKVPPDTDEEGENFNDLDDVEEPKEIKKKHHERFNENTLSEILDEERAYRVIKLKIDPRPSKRTQAGRDVNWIADYSRKKQIKRIKWKSKLFKLEKDIMEKTLFEQAEEIMDRAAGSFADWMNTLGATEEGIMTKDMIKQLFSIELAEGAAAATNIAPKEVRAVPHEIAMKWNLPQMSLENRVEQHFKDMRTIENKKPRIVAFGRTLPISLREWVPSAADKQLQPNFPEELRTKETLFKGIAHLRSTKLLVEHYLQHENLQRPQYLVDIGIFKPQIKVESTENVPLYDRFQKKKI